MRERLYSYWDIPVLEIEPSVRKRLFEKAVEHAQNQGFILPFTTGLILAWKDEFETSWLGRLAIRAWACSCVPLVPSDLAKVSAKLTELGAGFCALSGWMPFPECEGFFNVGASVHAVLERACRQTVLADNTMVCHLGEIPERWIHEIVNHVGGATWHDRHAKDWRLDPERVKQRRTNWIEAQLRGGDGFLVAVLNSNEELGAYLLVPLDRSRQIFGGPVVAGINAVAGSLEEGRGFVVTAALKGFEEARSIRAVPVVQYQPENKPIAHIVQRSFIGRYCVRYDIHWHREVL